MMRDKLDPALFALQRSAIREFSMLAAKTPGCVRLTLGEPCEDTPAAVRDAAKQALDDGKTHYIANNGAPELCAAIAAFERERYGHTYSEDEIIVTSGATEALFVALRGVLSPGDEIIIPSPAFVLYEQQARLCGGVPVAADTAPDGFQLRPERLLPLVTERTKAILINSPHNPTGTVYDRESIDTVCRIAGQRNIFVICDDVYRPIVYRDGLCFFSDLAAYKEKILLVQSFSKPYAMTGWRMGYLACHESIKERLELIHQFLTVSTPAPFQDACIAALEQDISPMIAAYRRRRDIALAALDRIGLEVRVPDGAFYLFPSLGERGSDSAAFCRDLISNAGVALTPGVCFGAEGYARLSYACDERTLLTGLERLEKYLNKG